MNQTQAEFDRYLIPTCAELNAPILHQLLNYAPLQTYILGGKGVGSQANGITQLIAGDRRDRTRVSSNAVL